MMAVADDLILDLIWSPDQACIPQSRALLMADASFLESFNWSSTLTVSQHISCSSSCCLAINILVVSMQYDIYSPQLLLYGITNDTASRSPTTFSPPTYKVETVRCKHFCWSLAALLPGRVPELTNVNESANAVPSKIERQLSNTTGTKAQLKMQKKTPFLVRHLVRVPKNDFI